MIPRNSFRSACLLFSAIAFFAPAFASAATVSCETFDPCTAGVCLKNGTCEATPANNGSACDTANTCTTGMCSNGECVETPVNNGKACETFDYCVQKSGSCSDGQCVGAALPNGSACRADVLGPCFTGTCTTISTFSFCTPVAKCGEWTNACEFNCNFVTGACESSPTHICDTMCTTATCEPGDNFEHTCKNPVDRADNTPCEDGSTCTAGDKCKSGDCVSGSIVSGSVCGDGTVEAPEECDDGDTLFAKGEYCDEFCTLVPCGRPTNSAGVKPTSSDALFALKAAVKLVTCDVRVCNVNSSGGVTSADALLILKKAVSIPVTLNCPVNAG